MKDLGKVDTDEVVRTFVLAEAHPLSGLAGDWFGPWFAQRGVSLEQVQARLRDTTDVEMLALARQGLAEGRGFGPNDRMLFKGFPRDAEWHRAVLVRDDFQTMVYLAFDAWLRLSSGTRRVVDGARAIEGGNAHGEVRIAARVNAIADALRAGGSIEALILGQQGSGPLVLIEGHHRATAIVLAEKMDDAPALIGHVDSFGDWTFR